ncbi:hypothetical protein NDR87_29960 [Nocardia sp. CDC159]|uniref:Uncharacterized protein n=1 Tax=Nocardia pulmonis TaxID=2951408 RepID=A0A9X2J098_9NOCA|nr:MULTISPECIES: hypothetical protein [Nocardia]MCM6777594.1 hypothetical protein [Nocardia pulmonis]MCM6790602.1 hypothetical protein [Nocardia sp. CDC159]
MPTKKLAIALLSGSIALATPSTLSAPAQAAPAATAQQAQDACIDFLLRTIRAMPAGTHLDIENPDKPKSPRRTAQVPPVGWLGSSDGGAFPVPRRYWLDFWLLGYPTGPQDAAFADVADIWNHFGWRVTAGTNEVGDSTLEAALPDGYTLDAVRTLDHTGITLGCSSNPFPGWATQHTPSPTRLEQ